MHTSSPQTVLRLEALKVFCDIASLHSFSKAAVVNHLSQPSVSRILHDLETRLGVQLIDRSRRSLPLTPLGQVYYEGCKRVLEEYLELEASIVRASSQLALTVRVAAIYSVGLGDIRQHVERFQAGHPHARVHIDYVHPDQVYERVLDGAAELGLVSYPRRHKDLDILPWREEEMVVACAPTHALAGRPAVSPADLDGERFVAFDQGLAIRRAVDQFLRHHGAAVEVVLEFDNIENIKRGIELGAGLALLPEPMLRREVQAGTLRALPLEGPRLVRPLGIIHRKNHHLGTAALGFIEMLQSGASPPLPSNGGNPAGRSNGTARSRKKRNVP